MVNFKGKHILSGEQFTKEELEHILEVAEDFRLQIEEKRYLELMKGYLLATLFFEPSTRTRLSFEAAMLRLGGGVIGFPEASTSSVAKGESIQDTIRTVMQYVDVIAIRHYKIGSAAEAAAVSTVPILNGGDGPGQHPTQALLDLFTIRREKKKIDGLKIALVGDLKHGRTVHALAELLKHYRVSFFFVSPPELRMPEKIINSLHAYSVPIDEIQDLEMAARESDIIYMTRVQKERFDDPEEYEKLKDQFVLTKEIAEINPSLTILHPLPRVNEIAPEVDTLPGAAYFRQAKNGLYVRMALIALVTGRV